MERINFEPGNPTAGALLRTTKSVTQKSHKHDDSASKNFTVAALGSKECSFVFSSTLNTVVYLNLKHFLKVCSSSNKPSIGLC